MNSQNAKRRALQEAMTFLGAMASGLEEAVGNPANNISYLAGEKLGMRFSRKADRTNNLEKALKEVARLLHENNCLWQFEPFKRKAEATLVRSTESADEIMLVFRDCMIRQSLFTYGHHQKGSLCNMMYGFFAGALKNIMGRASKLEIVHAGENGCYKRLTIYRDQESQPS